MYMLTEECLKHEMLIFFSATEAVKKGSRETFVVREVFADSLQSWASAGQIVHGHMMASGGLGNDVIGQCFRD